MHMHKKKFNSLVGLRLVCRPEVPTKDSSRFALLCNAEENGEMHN